MIKGIMFRHLSFHHKIIAAFTALYILIFGAHYAQALDYEFLGYLVVLILGFLIVFLTIEKTRFPYHILWGLSLWGLLHMAGGSVPVGDGVLYGYLILPIFDGGGEFVMFKMDQFIHMLGFGVTTLVMLRLLRNAGFAGGHEVLAAITAVIAAMGLGALNETIEFLAVVFVPDTGVGGYFNTSLDLIFNMLGATLAVGGYYAIKKLKRDA